MKKFAFTLVLLALVITTSAQFTETNFNDPALKFNSLAYNSKVISEDKTYLGMPEDKFNHFTICTMSSFSIEMLSQQVLYNKVGLKWWQSRLIGAGLGIGLTSLAGHLKEVHDQNNGGFYSREDLKYDLGGALTGSALVSITLNLVYWGKEPVNHVPQGVDIYGEKKEVPFKQKKPFWYYWKKH